MGKAKVSVVKRSLLSWAFAGNMKLQVLLSALILVLVAARVVPLEMQKRVVNEAIFLRDFPLLVRYCGIYLVAVILSSGLKYATNVLQTLIGQRAMAQMRKDLYHHILTLPLNFFRRTQPGTVVSSLVVELSAAGELAGMALAVPAINILTLLAFAAYLLWLNALLAALSLSIYPVVLLIVPMLQKRANKANKRRVDMTRKLTSRITESIAGIHEVHGNASFTIENRKFDNLVDELLSIRIVWSLYKFGIKVTNNLFNNLSPFLIFILGGYLAMNGKLELGALVAFLSAQEKLYDPWKELIDFYQTYQDASIRYRRTMEVFDVEAEHRFLPEGRTPLDLPARVELKNLSFSTEDNIQLLSKINLSLAHGDQLALVGFSGSGKSTLAQCIGQLYSYTGGHLYMGSREVADLSKLDMAYNTGFVSQNPFIFSGTIEENLLYACRARIEGGAAVPAALLPPPPEEGEEALFSLPGEEKEAPAEPAVLPSLDDMIEVLQQTGLFVDVLRFGLTTTLDRGRHRELMERLIEVRKDFRLDFGDDLSDHLEFFNEDAYLYHSSISDNLVFGTPLKDEFAPENLHRDPYFLAFLSEADLKIPLVNLGAELSRQTVDIVGNLPPEEIFFRQSPISPDEIDEYRVIVDRLRKGRLHHLSAAHRDKLLELALRFTAGIHKMIPFPGMLESLILEGRALFREKIAKDDPAAFSFYRESDYIYSQNILNNILFGKIKNTGQQAQEKINQSVIQLLIAEDFLETIVELGMQFQVGTKGDRLSGGQKQKLAIARAFLKEPPLLIMDEATSALDNRSQSRIQNLLENRWKGKSTLISVVHRLDIIRNYDKIAVMKAGKIVELGGYNELINKKGVLYELVHGKK